MLLQLASSAGQVQVGSPLPTSLMPPAFKVRILALTQRLVRKLLGAGGALEALLRCWHTFDRDLST